MKARAAVAGLLLVLLLAPIGLRGEPAEVSPVPEGILAFADGATSEAELTAALRALADRGRGGAGAGPALVALLAENADLYRGRGPREAIRLRACLLATLADVGPPPEALPKVLADLAHGHWPLLQAAAARAAGALGAGGTPAVPYLVDVLQPDTKDDRVPARLCGEEGSPGRTTARLEAVRALARIGPAARSAVPMLEAIVGGGGDGYFSGMDDLRAAAEDALRVLRRPGPEDAHDQHHDHHCGHAGTADETLLASPWLAPEERGPGPLDPGLEATDQDGLRRSLASLKGQPLALTFFYARCDNPDKCPVTVARLAGLQRALDEAGLGAKVRLAAITLDPELDTPWEMKRFGESLGVRYGSQAVFLNLARPDLEAFLRRIEA
ncbi:MAG TPA: SCO family protein, partial [Thermoanaerobaculia bacterium]|nr:SCO family protein [Thermoanaerobaculia bacterium]